MKQLADNIFRNGELAHIFHRMAACYRYLGPDQRFRSAAYENASKTIGGLREDITCYASDVKCLDSLSGIGESIAEKIIEFITTGKIAAYEKLKKEVPENLLELMDITGLGPATVKLLHQQLGINNQQQLAAALKEGKLNAVKGFGKKKIENLIRGLKLFKETSERILLSNALETGTTLLKAIHKIDGVAAAAIAGSLRRRKETIGDIDIIICAKENLRQGISNAVLKAGKAERILARGEEKLSFMLRKFPLQVDIRFADEESYGAMLLYFTGSKEHNIKLRDHAKLKGCKLNEYGVFDLATGKMLAGKTENDIYRVLGMQYIAPELREQTGEIEQAIKHTLPQLVEFKDIIGDMQMHSNWSDGKSSVEMIARHIQRKFPTYEYIVITDHSPSVRIAGGIQPGEFQKQFEEIDMINRKLGNRLVKKGVEVDILNDGGLDLADDLLQQFDWVTAAIHSGFRKNNTERLLGACRHPYVHCISHPAGRLIGRREAYPVDWNELFPVLARTGTAIEINAQPERLDLKDDLVKMAVQNGVVITVSTDAHMLNQFDYMTLGVAVARRGWCSASNILNTQPWDAIEIFKQRKRKALNPS